MKVVIAGASGGIGSAVFEACKAEGWEVLGIDARLVPLDQYFEDEADAFVNCAGEFYPKKISGLRFLRIRHDILIRPILDFLAFLDKGKKPLHIIGISSVSARGGIPTMAEYSASRAALESFIKTLAVESAPHIRANVVSCGAIKTKMHEKVTQWMNEDTKKAYEEAHPLGFGEPKDVAEAVVFLLKSRWITGTVLKVDGGWSAKNG